MSKNCKKRFIRNGDQPLPKNTSVETKISETETSESEESMKLSPKQREKIFEVPTKNYSKYIEKRMGKVENLKINKQVLNKDERSTLNEKITRNVLNYPFDKKLYKELISLQLKDKPNIPALQPLSVNYEPTIRDKIPKLEDFYVPAHKKEFNIPVMSTVTAHTSIRSYDGLRMHKLMARYIYP